MENWVKILVLHNKYQISGGEDTVVQNEVELLRRNGHQVELVYFDNSEIKGLLNTLKAAVEVLYSFSASARLKPIISSFKPDVIHVHNFFPKLSPSVFYLAQKMQIPIVQTIHNFRMICPSAILMHEEKIFESSLHQRFAFTAVAKKVYRGSYLQTFVLALHNFVHNQIGTWKSKVDGLIFLTDFAKEKFLSSKLRLNNENLFIKPNFVEDQGFNYQRETHFLFVGRLSTEKGIDLLLEAFSQSPHQLKIIGTGPLENMVREASDKHTNIEFLGKQPHDAVIEYMKNCRALVFPSIWYEGMPMTIIEAFSTGCPVIASDLGAMKNLISHEYNGVKFEVNDTQALINSLDSVTEHMPENARNTFLENYNSEKNYSELIAIYTEVINRQHSSTRHSH